MPRQARRLTWINDSPDPELHHAITLLGLGALRRPFFWLDLPIPLMQFGFLSYMTYSEDRIRYPRRPLALV